MQKMVHALLRSFNLGRAVGPGIRRDFVDLRQDPYVEAGFRRKEVARFVVGRDGEMRRSQHGPVLQSLMYNPVHGGVVRRYHEYEPGPEARRVIREFARLAEVPDGAEVLVQAQRISAPGLPAIEGWHRDGAEVLGIYVVARDNVVGGETQVRRLGADLPFFAGVVPPGYLVMFDDRRVEHYVTPVEAREPDHDAHRDVLILTTPSFRP